MATPAVPDSTLSYALACAVLAVHALFIVWVSIGAVFTAGRRLLSWLHIGSLLWAVWIEVGPWPCPLTLAEQWLEVRAGIPSYRGAFLLHYLDKLVYPDIRPALLTEAAVAVALMNAGIYIRRWLRARASKRTGE
jgi:hypothetical protein